MIRRGTRRSQHGLTLIELLVSIAILGIAVVPMVGSFAIAERNAQLAQDQANLEVSMRHVTDWLRSSSVAYVTCAPEGSTSTYTIPATLDGVALNLSGSNSVTVRQGSSADIAGANQWPLYDCGATPGTSPGTTAVAICQTTAPAHTCDWGVQRLTVTIHSSLGRTLTRVVFKGVT